MNSKTKAAKRPCSSRPSYSTRVMIMHSLRDVSVWFIQNSSAHVHSQSSPQSLVFGEKCDFLLDGRIDFVHIVFLHLFEDPILRESSIRPLAEKFSKSHVPATGGNHKETKPGHWREAKSTSDLATGRSYKHTGPGHWREAEIWPLANHSTGKAGARHCDGS